MTASDKKRKGRSEKADAVSTTHLANCDNHDVHIREKARRKRGEKEAADSYCSLFENRDDHEFTFEKKKAGEREAVEFVPQLANQVKRTAQRWRQCHIHRLQTVGTFLKMCLKNAKHQEEEKKPNNS